MTDTADMIRINQVGTVFVPVADQKRALKFYLGKLRFEKRADFRYGDGGRWIEVAPPGAANTIALVPPNEGESAGGAEIAHMGRHRSGLVSLGVTVKDPVPPQFFFRDSEGNRFLIVEAA